MEEERDLSAEARLKKIAEKLKELRKDKGYKSAEIFAYDNNLSRVSYWRIENGFNITMKTLIKLLDIHRISLSEFFSDIE
ncbi:MAG: helix-turn-helix domain-containing protein [Alistipes sp.]|nr:helix-turn-helix domain-containing protein [Alistipes sp.]MCD8174010.1 helix-turn-helix domain-containing protein [Alistipes sp.]